MRSSAILLVLALTHLVVCKVYERCELVHELSKKKHRIPPQDVGTWVCIVQHESQYNTSAVGHLNSDGSGDHGLFQISDLYWCSPPGVGLACGLNCEQLEDDEITDDIVCARRIYRATRRRTGDGFTAWAVYGPHCRGDNSAYTDNCEEDEVATTTVQPRTTTTKKPTTTTKKPTTTTKKPTTTTKKPTTTTKKPKTTTKRPTTKPPKRKPTTTTTTTTSTTTSVPEDLFSTGSNVQEVSTESLRSWTKPVARQSQLGTSSSRPSQQMSSDPAAAWLSVHYDPRFLDEYP